MTGHMDITMIIIGWNEKGLIGFEHGGRYLSYINAPWDDEEEIKRIKSVYPHISDATVKEVNKYQDEHQVAEFASRVKEGGKRP